MVRRERGRYRISINVQRRGYALRGGGPSLGTIVLYTRDRRLARFLARAGASQAAWDAMRRATARYTCLDLYSGPRFYRLERAVARAVARHYRAAARRRTRTPDVMISVDDAENSPVAPVTPCHPRT